MRRDSLSNVHLSPDFLFDQAMNRLVVQSSLANSSIFSSQVCRRLQKDVEFDNQHPGHVRGCWDRRGRRGRHRHVDLCSRQTRGRGSAYPVQQQVKNLHC